CQARKRGARYSSTERPGIAELLGILGKADVGLRHHLLGYVFELRRCPCRLLRRLRGLVLALVAGLRGFDRQVQLTHLSLRQVTPGRRVSCSTGWPAHAALDPRPRAVQPSVLYHSSRHCGRPPTPPPTYSVAGRRRSGAMPRPP